MPKIDAPTVREHHEAVKARLIAAADRILRESGSGVLSAGAVAREAGIARSSIYRYVDSVDDLRLLTLAAYMPRWRNAVFDRVDDGAEPADRLRQFAVACVLQTCDPSHAWFMSLTRRSSSRRHDGAAPAGALVTLRAGGAASPQPADAAPAGARRTPPDSRKAPPDRHAGERAAIRDEIVGIHTTVDEFIAECWKEMGVPDPDAWMRFSRALLFEAFGQIEAGTDAREVADRLDSAIAGMSKAAQGNASSSQVGAARDRVSDAEEGREAARRKTA